MLSLTRKADYALVAMAELARQMPGRASAREISEAVGIPLPVLTNVLHELMHDGLISSRKGSKGGYCLARPAERITLAEMIAAIQGPIRLTACCGDEGDTDGHDCSLEVSCRIKEPVRRVHRGLREYFDRITLAHLIAEEALVELKVSGAESVGRDGSLVTSGTS